MNKCLQFWMSGVNDETSIKTLVRMELKILKFYNIHWIRELHARRSTIINEWCLQWPEVTSLNKWRQQWYQYQQSWRSEVTHILKSGNFEWVELTMIPASRLSTEFYNIDWVRRLQARIFTIMNEWCLQWPQVYNFELVESTMKPVSTFLTEWSH